MKITNKFGLPEAYVRAVKNDPYEKGESQFSVTGLLAPPRQKALLDQYQDLVEEDAIDRVWSLLGQGTHHILQRAARPGIDIVEQRYFATFNGVIVSGQIDLLEQDTGTLSDWKVTKAFAFSKKGGSGLKPEWVAQLNMQLELLRQNGLDARSLQIVGILKDFDKKRMNDPALEIVVVDIPIWEREKTVSFINERIKAHLDALKSLPECTTKETWAGRRCQGWCAVKDHCDQYKQMQKTGLVQTKETEEVG
jgi:hypothetical protein